MVFRSSCPCCEGPPAGICNMLSFTVSGLLPAFRRCTGIAISSSLLSSFISPCLLVSGLIWPNWVLSSLSFPSLQVFSSFPLFLLVLDLCFVLLMRKERTQTRWLLQLCSKSREQDILHCSFQFPYSCILSCLFFPLCLCVFLPSFMCYYFLSLLQSSDTAACLVTGLLLGAVVWASTLVPEEPW